jgi:hypothetical protein
MGFGNTPVGLKFISPFSGGIPPEMKQNRSGKGFLI